MDNMTSACDDDDDDDDDDVCASVFCALYLIRSFRTNEFFRSVPDDRQDRTEYRGEGKGTVKEQRTNKKKGKREERIIKNHQ